MEIMKAIKDCFAESKMSQHALGVAMGYPESSARKSAWQFLSGTTDPRFSMVVKFARAVQPHVIDSVAWQTLQNFLKRPEMANKPLIGINLDYVGPGKLAGAQTRLHAGYADCVAAAGGTAILLPPVDAAQLDIGLLSLLDGVILAGNPLDMDSKRFGLEPHPAVHPMPVRKANFDFLLIDYVMKYKVPTVAVACGLLELNVAAKGTIYQHLPEDLPKALPHKDLTGGPHRHAVQLIPKTRLDKIYGGGEIRVNSYHHQAVKDVAPGFTVCAKALDGVIEAIESTDPEWFCFGVQWHPHSETSSALDIHLFEAFIQAADHYRDS